VTTKEEADRALEQLTVVEWVGGHLEPYDATGDELRAVVRSRLAELEAQVPRWTPVAERLPREDNQPIQVIVLQQGHANSRVVVPAYFGMGHFFRYARDEGLDWTKPIESHWVVTHWMPMAQPPEAA
jgi:hypothetical protein